MFKHFKELIDQLLVYKVNTLTSQLTVCEQLSIPLVSPFFGDWPVLCEFNRGIDNFVQKWGYEIIEGSYNFNNG